MKQIKSGMVAFVGVLALAGCYSYASEDINNTNYNTVQATPVFAVTKVGDSDQVLVRLVNDANVGAITSYTVSNVGAGIDVHYQQHYRPIYDATLDTLVDVLDKNQQQYYVAGKLPGKWSFTLTPTLVNTGISTTVTVLVSPDSARFTLSKTTGIVAGDTILVTAQANTVFSTTSVFSFQVGPNAPLVALSADSTVASIIAAPGDSGRLTVTKVGLPQSPATAPLTLQQPVGATGFSLVPAITIAPTTASTLTPAFGGTMTLQLGNNLRFLPTATVTIGGRTATILSRSADSSTATIVPQGGSTGAIAYTNVVLSFLNSVPLNIPGDKSITVGPVVSDPNATALATASTFVLPDSGVTKVLSDGGPFTAGGACAIGTLSGTGCRYYKVVNATARLADYTLTWDPASLSDLGLYLVNAAGTTGTLIADGFGNQQGGTETSAAAGFTIPVGTSYLVVVYYSGPVPPFYQVKIVGR